jgi:predicted DCC family thiol-disulfide oxidoreductase YuxK
VCAQYIEIMTEQALLIYDGDCGFCTTSAAWIGRRWRQPCSAVAWQELGEDGLAKLGLTVADVTNAAWFAEGDVLLRAERAVAAALKHASPGWAALGRLIHARPTRWVAALGYRVVSRYRHLLPGSTDACRISDNL